MDRSTTQRRTQPAIVEHTNALHAAKRYAENCRAANTWRAYKSGWHVFESWCHVKNVAALPAEPETIALFLADEAERGLSPSSLRRRLAAIQLIHFGAGHPSPHRTRPVLEMIRHIVRGWTKPLDKKVPIPGGDIKRMADAVEPGTCKGLRDRAILLFGFAGAFRRSELVRLDVTNLKECEEGLLVTVDKSKTDRDAKGQRVVIAAKAGSPYCPVQALYDWLEAAEIRQGALFRRMFRNDHIGAPRLSAQSIALIVKNHAASVGLDPIRLSGHSLRSGSIMNTAETGTNIFRIAEHSRHRSLDVLRTYALEE